jgi:hypothetical protein
VPGSWAGIARSTDCSSLRHCFLWLPALPRMSLRMSSPIGSAASRNPALGEQWAAASHAAHRREIVKRPTTETDRDGRYWITVEGERIQVPLDKILQHTDNPTGRGVACLRHYDGHPIVRCFVRASEG